MTPNPEESNKIIYHCRQCMQDISFEIPEELLEKKTFPFTLEDIHGDPPHRLKITVNKHLEVDSFEIQDIEDTRGIGHAAKVTEEVLGEIGLMGGEIELYLMCTGLGPVTLGEMAILADVTTDDCKVIVEKFVRLGLFKAIEGAREYYQALPPYAALLAQLDRFGEFISVIKNSTPQDLQGSFSEFEQQAQGVQDLKQFVEYLSNTKQEVSDSVSKQRGLLDSNLKALMEQRAVIDTIRNLNKQSELLIERHVQSMDGQKGNTMGLIKKQIKALDDQLVTSTNMLDEKFTDFAGKLDKSLVLVDQQVDALTDQFKALQDKISQNLGKLRLGLIQKTVEDIISKVLASEMEEIKHRFQVEFVSKFRGVVDNIKTSFRSEFVGSLRGLLERQKDQFQLEFGEPFRKMLTDSIQTFESKFGEPLREMVTKLGEEIENTVSNASIIGGDLMEMFTGTLDQVDFTLTQAQTKITGISDTVMQSFEDLRVTFSDRVINTIDEVLEKILDKLAVSSLTVEEFWEEAKRVIKLTMKDVWFVRTPEGMRAQIIDTTSRVKMRVLIVAPTLSDVDIPSLFEIPKTRNIRVCCFIDPTDAKHQDILDQIAAHPNISVRHRDLQNLWGINRDYEEIIVGIVSKDQDIPDAPLEVAGIGSIIGEHIKIFVPILEDAWVGSRKEIQYTPSPVTTPASRVTPSSTSQASRPSRAATPAKPAAKSAPVSATPSPTPVPSTPAPTSKLAAQATQKPAPVTKASIAGKTDGLDVSIVARVDGLASQLGQGSPKDFSNALGDLRDFIFENKGFSVVLNDIRNWATQLKSKSAWDEGTLSIIQKRLDHWRETFGGEDIPTPAAGAGAQPDATGMEEPDSQASTAQPTAQTGGAGSEVKQEFDVLLKMDLRKIELPKLAMALEALRDFIAETVGFSSILKEMGHMADKLKKMNKLDDKTLQLLQNRLVYWKEKVD